MLLTSDSSPQGPNWSYQAIGDAFDVSATTITAVRRAYGEGGLEAALNRKQPAREYPRRLDGETEAHLVAMACSQPPEGHARWSLHWLRDRVVEMGYAEQVSHATIRQVVNKRTETLAQAAIVYSPAEGCGVCMPNGGGVGGVSTL